MKLLLVFVLSFTLLGLSAVSAAPAETHAPESCGQGALGSDVEDMLALIDGDVFDSDLWTMRLQDYEGTNTATWESYGFGAVAHIQYQHYDCGATEQQLDDYFSPSGLENLLVNYKPYLQLAECSVDGLRLLEFKGVLNGITYHLRYWGWLPSSTRLASVHLVFPVGREAKMNRYSRLLFPALPHCPSSPR
jgi:hypothetical protein